MKNSVSHLPSHISTAKYITMLDGTKIECFHHYRKFYCTVLLKKQLLVPIPCELST